MDKEHFKTARQFASLTEGRRDWYRIENLADGGADAFIYNEIGFLGLTADDFVKDLAKVSGPVNLHLNSPGGEVFDGLAIYTALKQRGGVTVYVDALAASIASVIAMAGEKIVMAKHATMMIHDAFGMAIGNAEDMIKMSERLEASSDTIASVYQERAGGQTKTWRNRMKAETWYTADEAVAAGLADEVTKTPSKVKNELASFDLSIFKHVPATLGGEAEAKTEGAQMNKIPAELVTKLSNEAGEMTAAACMSADMYECLTDIARDWLKDGVITVEQLATVSELITSLVRNLNDGLSSAGVAENIVTDDDDDDDDRRCRNCGAVIDAGDRYCPNCGGYTCYANAEKSVLPVGKLIDRAEYAGCSALVKLDNGEGFCPNPVAWELENDKVTLAVCDEHFNDIYASQDGFTLAQVEGVVEDKVIAYADHGIETGKWSAPSLSDFTDQSWDELDDDEKQRIADHFTSKDGDTFADLHLPHHRASKEGIGPAVKAGVDAAKARVIQTNASDTALQAHLEQHRAQYGEIKSFTELSHEDEEVDVLALLAQAVAQTDEEEGE